ncbi:MAG: hypothetical protein P1V81_01435 [Planctomycetota bacterium]|nr:hypothetical protein [Planctomycetota bacterium]
MVNRKWAFVVGMLLVGLVVGLQIRGGGEQPRIKLSPAPAPDESAAVSEVKASFSEASGTQVASTVKRRPAPLDPASDGQGGAPSGSARDAWPSHWIGNPAVTALAEHLGLEPSQVVEEIAEVWPELLDQEIAPLTPWSDIEPTFSQTVIDQAIGDESIWVARIEQRLLGQPFQEYIEDEFHGALSESDRWALHAELIACSGEPLRAYQEYSRHLAAAIDEVVQAGKFDKFPYLALPDHKVHTETGSGKLAFGGYGSVAGNWVYCLELMKEEYPDVYNSKLELERAILKAKKGAKAAASNYK